MDIERRILRDDTLVLRLGTTLDNNNAHEMVELICVSQSTGFIYLIIDMADLEFLSSAGVGSILGTVETSREAGGDIILCNISPTILHVLEVLDLAEYLTIQPDLKQATASIGVAV